MLKIKNIFPKRKPDANKGDYGRTLIIAGSSGMLGAAALASRGALRVGSGLTYLAVPKELVNYANTITPEVITLPFEKISGIEPDAIAIGPGLGQSPKIIKILYSLVIGNWALVIDADAINILSKHPQLLRRKKTSVILTPHPGEMSRLINKSVAYIQKNRIKVAKEAARQFGCIIVLKGSKTVVADWAGKVYINNTGNPGLAKGGAGDVLTGMIAGLVAQGRSLWDAAVAGVYLHGLAGDLAAREKGEYAMIASDLVEKIPDAIQQNN